jgi:molybdopterin synthase sulfur carrier subunit
MIRVILPYHLRNLAGVDGEIELEAGSNTTLGHVLDALEERHPILRGTLRDRNSLRRRQFVRFFACREDLSHSPLEIKLPKQILSGEEPFFIVGAMAGG